jgi:hypothetical protein
MPKEKPDTDTPEVVVRPIFRRGSELDGVPEVQIVSPSGPKLLDVASGARPAVDLKDAPKVWLLSALLARVLRVPDGAPAACRRGPGRG